MIVDVAAKPTYLYTGTRPLDTALPAIVFVHGAANDHSVWALQSRYFAYHGWNALAVDLPAHGRSAGDALASVEAIADWIKALLDAVAVDRAVLVGHSMGALSSLECAARHPERVAKLALLGPAAPMTVSDTLLAAAFANDHTAIDLIVGWSHSAGKKLGGNPVPGAWMTGNTARLMERTPPGVLHTDLAACHRYAAGVASAARVRCPSLVIMGARDIMAPPKNAQALIAALREARTVTLPGCGHALMAEAPDAVLDALRAFV
jgi:pimeloyl-ACP methyl ester carboxylesterase